MPGPAYYPPSEPYDSGWLEVGDGNELYWETCGNPLGKPAVVLHGGPGSGCSTGMRKMWNPDAYRVVLFDQRNCGRSRPHAAELTTDLSANTTEHLLADIEALREHLGIERWLVWGGSWGATLGLAYVTRFPQRVSEAVFVAVTNTSPAEVDWLYGGVGRIFPAEWDEFRALVGLGPDATGTDLAVSYDELLQGPDLDVRERAARAWTAWEEAIVAVDAGHTPGRWEDDPRGRLAFARMCAHYFAHHAWLTPGRLLADVAGLGDIPATLIHGRLDLGSPLVTAWRTAQAWPGSELHVVAGAGHSTGPGMSELMVGALDRYAGVSR
jgi:proline iminopeptidase